MPLTASCHMNRIHISLAGNSPTQVAAGSAGSLGGGGSRTDTMQIDGEFRSYANGSTRLLIGTNKTHTQNVALINVTADQVVVLNTLAGVTCLFRDTYGARFYGSFLVVDRFARPLSGLVSDNTQKFDLAITIQEVTYTEGV